MTNPLTSPSPNLVQAPNDFSGDAPLPSLRGPINFQTVFASNASVKVYTEPTQPCSIAKTEAVGERALSKKRAASASSQTPMVRTRGKHSLPPGDRLAAEANNSFVNKDYNSALDLYEKVLMSEPQHETALLRRSMCYWRLGRLKEAITCLDHLLNIYPANANAWAKRGAILIQQHQYPEALAALTKSAALDTTPFFIEYILLLDCYFSFEQVQSEAYFYLHHIYYNNEGNPLLAEADLHLLRGIFYASVQRYRPALQEFSIAAVTSEKSLAIRIAKIIENSLTRINCRSIREKSLSVGVVPISVLLNQLPVSPPPAFL